MQAFSFIESLYINVVQWTDARHSHNDGTCGKNQRTTQVENPPTTWRKKSTANRWREPHPFYRSRAGDVSFGPLWRAGCWQGKTPSAGPKQPRIWETSLNITYANWKKLPLLNENWMASAKRANWIPRAAAFSRSLLDRQHSSNPHHKLFQTHLWNTPENTNFHGHPPPQSHKIRREIICI